MFAADGERQCYRLSANPLHVRLWVRSNMGQWYPNAEKILEEVLGDKNPADGPELAKRLGNAMDSVAPIWMTVDTEAECQALEEFVGGPVELARMTGSRAYSRFSVHLITQYLNNQPPESKLGPISLVSSFGTSVFCGKIMPVDISDAAGMNLMEIATREWSASILDYVCKRTKRTLEEIRAMLPQPQPSWQSACTIAPYWCAKYGFSPDCKVVNWTGDNASSLVGLGCIEPGDVSISLGTSDTCVCLLAHLPEALAIGHVFPHPVYNDKYFAMLCYSNGDGTRRYIRDNYADGDWESFSRNLETTSPSDVIGIYATVPEITPPFRLSSPCYVYPETGTMDSGMQCRAAIESRALAMKTHLRQLNPDITPRRILVTGGAAASDAICQIVADVFEAPVSRANVTDSAMLGSAMRAADATHPISHAIAARSAGTQITPRTDVDYSKLQKLYVKAEAALLASVNSPAI